MPVTAPIQAGAISNALLAAGAVTPDKLSGNQAGAAPAIACRAWVNFKGTGTVAIRSSGNVSSITDNGAGDYTVNFTAAMPDADYSVVLTGSGKGGVQSAHLMHVNWVTPPTAALVRIGAMNVASALEDDEYVNLSIFR